MKKIVYAIAALALVFTGCAKELDNSTTDNFSKVRLHVKVADQMTKVSADNDGRYHWQAGDKITVLNSDGDANEFSTVDGGASVNFSTDSFVGDAIGKYAMYPASAGHVAVEDAIGFNLPSSYIWKANSTNMPMLAKIVGDEATFKAVGGVLKLVCYNIPANAVLMEFAATSKQISGEFEILDGTVETPVITTAAKASNNNIVNFDFTGHRSDNMVFYIPLPTGTIDGFTVTFYNDDPDVVFTKTATKNLSVGRNQMILAPALNCAGATVLVSEDFSGYDDEAVPSGTVGGVSYSCTDGTSTNTTVQKGASENYAGGETPEILIGRTGGTFKISGISCDGITTMILTFKKNNNALSIKATDGITVSGATSGAGIKTITLTNEGTGTPKVPLTSFDLTFEAGSSNVRVDDILITAPVSFTAPSISTGVATLTVGVGQTSKTTDCTLSNAIDDLGISMIVSGDNTSWIESITIADGKLTLTVAGANVSGADYTATLTLKATGATNKVVTLKQTNSLVPNPSVTVTPGNAKFTATWTGDTHATSYVAYLRTTDSDPVDVNGDPTSGTTDISSSITESEGVYSITDYSASNDQAYYLYIKVGGVSSNYSTPTTFVKKNFTPTAAPVPINITTSTLSSSGDSGKITVACAKGDGASAPAVYSSKVRLYAKNTITITSTDKNIAKIEFSFNKNGTKAYATVSASGGSYSSGGDSTSSSDIKVDTWTGDAKTIIITLGSSGQRELSQVSVTYKN